MALANTDYGSRISTLATCVNDPGGVPEYVSRVSLTTSGTISPPGYVAKLYPFNQ